MHVSHTAGSTGETDGTLWAGYSVIGTVWPINRTDRLCAIVEDLRGHSPDWMLLGESVGDRAEFDVVFEEGFE